MPTYEYECERSGKRFEVRQPIVDEPLKTCPECGGNARRVISAGGGFIVRGGASAQTPSCGRDTPCCGRDVRCDSPGCE
jgi:putative FmdB family regulatory protein